MWSRHHLDDLLAHTGEVGAKVEEDPGRHPFALADHSEQDVLRSDVVVS